MIVHHDPVPDGRASKQGPRTLSSLGLSTSSGLEIRGLALSSHQVRNGYLFAALQGSATHGAHFADDAVARGAVAILTDKTGERIIRSGRQAGGARVFVDRNPRSVLARMASSWHGKVPDNLVAVTGTNGKTSVAVMCRQIWERLGNVAVNIGTTGIGGSYRAPVNLTTPDALALHAMLSTMAGQGVTHLSMEASSHGLDQSRLDGLEFRCAAFTNLTHDHLDYHGTIENYLASKSILFNRLLSNDGVAVIWMHDRYSDHMIEVARSRTDNIIRVGIGTGELALLDQRFGKSGQEIRFAWHGREHECQLGLLGSFQAHNLLVAVGLAIGSGSNPDEVMETLGGIEAIPGRMECVAVRENRSAIIVDYAHTPAALESALKQLRNHFSGKLHVVFGAGGDRDRSKRPLMGKEAARNADRVIVTDDNPRNENPASIRQEIMTGCPDAIEVGDRAEAILVAASRLQQGDVLLIAGKGHESGQEIGDTIIPFNDSEQASMAARLLDGKSI